MLTSFKEKKLSDFIEKRFQMQLHSLDSMSVNTIDSYVSTNRRHKIEVKLTTRLFNELYWNLKICSCTYNSARRLIGSRIIESAAYLAPLCLSISQNMSANWIIWLLLSFLCRPKVILLSGGHCIFIKRIIWDWTNKATALNSLYPTLTVDISISFLH